jgi:hypothetical protein
LPALAAEEHEAVGAIEQGQRNRAIVLLDDGGISPARGFAGVHPDKMLAQTVDQGASERVDAIAQATHHLHGADGVVARGALAASRMDGPTEAIEGRDIGLLAGAFSDCVIQRGDMPHGDLRKSRMGVRTAFWKRA